MNMTRFAAMTALALGLALVVHFQVENRRLLTAMENLELKVERLEARLASEKASSALLKKLAASNHHTISAMKRKAEVTVTAYSPRRRETDSTPTLTATNSKVRAGIVAVSRDLFDKGWVFGRKVYIQGLGVYVIDDLMAADKSEQIDIFFHDTDKAIAFGKKKRTAYLLGA